MMLTALQECALETLLAWGQSGQYIKHVFFGDKSCSALQWSALASGQGGVNGLFIASEAFT